MSGTDDKARALVVWARKHVHRLTTDEIHRLRTGQGVVELSVPGRPGWCWPLSFGRGVLPDNDGLYPRGRAMLALLDELDG